METSGFFTAKLQNGSYDRTYAAEQFAQYFARFISNGVFLNLASDALMVEASPDEGMKVSLNAGDAFIKGYWYSNDDSLVKEIQPADGVLKRIDLVVLRYYNEEREIKSLIITGTPSNNPVEPELSRNADFYDIAVAKINMPAGAVKVLPQYIVDMRLDSNYCGSVGALVEQIDTSKYGAQLNDFIHDYIEKSDIEFEDWVDKLDRAYQEFLNMLQEKEGVFDEWFAHIKEVLSGDAAGNIMLEIENLENEVKKDLSKVAYLEPVEEEQTIEEVKGLDADSLGGHTPEYFASGEELVVHEKIIGAVEKSGHVKLSDSVDSESDSTKGIAATPKAIKVLNEKLTNRIDEEVKKFDTVFQSVSKGKSLLASTLADMGVTVNTDAKFELIDTCFRNEFKERKKIVNRYFLNLSDWGDYTKRCKSRTYGNLPFGNLSLRLDVSHGESNTGIRLILSKSIGMMEEDIFTITVSSVSTSAAGASAKLYFLTQNMGLCVYYTWIDKTDSDGNYSHSLQQAVYAKRFDVYYDTSTKSYKINLSSAITLIGAEASNLETKYVMLLRSFFNPFNFMIVKYVDKDDSDGGKLSSTYLVNGIKMDPSSIGNIALIASSDTSVGTIAIDNYYGSITLNGYCLGIGSQYAYFCFRTAETTATIYIMSNASISKATVTIDVDTIPDSIVEFNIETGVMKDMEGNMFVLDQKTKKFEKISQATVF